MQDSSGVPLPLQPRRSRAQQASPPKRSSQGASKPVNLSMQKIGYVDGGPLPTLNAVVSTSSTMRHARRVNHAGTVCI